jgi:hypothetical protein
MSRNYMFRSYLQPTVCGMSNEVSMAREVAGGEVSFGVVWNVTHIHVQTAIKEVDRRCLLDVDQFRILGLPSAIVM